MKQAFNTMNISDDDEWNARITNKSKYQRWTLNKTTTPKPPRSQNTTVAIIIIANNKYYYCWGVVQIKNRPTTKPTEWSETTNEQKKKKQHSKSQNKPLKKNWRERGGRLSRKRKTATGEGEHFLPAHQNLRRFECMLFFVRLHGGIYITILCATFVTITTTKRKKAKKKRNKESEEKNSNDSGANCLELCSGIH